MKTGNGWFKYLISLIVTLLLGAYAYSYTIDCKANKLAETVTTHITKEEVTLETINRVMPELLTQIQTLNQSMNKPGK